MPYTIKVPACFYDDHDSRELPTPREISRTSRTVTVAVSDPNLAELLNDAEHYADRDGPTAADPEYAGLRKSARATVRAIKKLTKKSKEGIFW
jgi:hypothetical protein